MFNTLVVGAGLSGATCARMLAERGHKVLVVEKRGHIAGNAYDCYNSHGILIHRYGPHIFHTQHKDVWEFLSRFTSWREYQHKVLAYVQGQLVPMPINLDTVNRLYGAAYTADNIEQEFFAKVRNDLPDSFGNIDNARDMAISKVGHQLYEWFFRGYTKKQWGVYPEELDAEVTARIPLRMNRDDRYFSDPYQGIPAQGFTHMIQTMLDHENIGILLNVNYKQLLAEGHFNHVICSGPIDEFFDYRFGPLPYRSIRFEWKTYEQEWYQPVAVVNYPNDYDFTRITEFKHLTGQSSPRTTVVREYPCSEGDPYYPVPQAANRQLYKQYLDAAAEMGKVSFIGRLGMYKYANMDAVVKDALELAQTL